MEKILERIENYHFINYLLPGIIFGAIYTKVTGSDFFDSNIVIAIIEYYFVGLVLSRLGSMVIKPLLEKLKIIKNKKYEDYIESSKKDEKIDMLQKEGNQYRTYIATFLCLFIQQVYCWIFKIEFYNIKLLIIFLVLIVLFIFSYRKQTIFITKRIEKVK